MIGLPWVRTMLAAVGFVWAMSAWHYHEYTINRERSYIMSLIVRLCAADYPDSQTGRDECEIVFRTRLVGGVSVGGNVDVTGTVDVNR